jgi:steroid 5-alpha reductase family enzyme
MSAHAAAVVFAAAFVAVEMSATWLVGRVIRNYGVVDPVWALGFGAIAWSTVAAGIWARGAAAAPAGSFAFAALILLWSLRLGGHLLIRFLSHHPREDVRYAELRTRWGAGVDGRMFGFFLVQGALQIVLSIPFFLGILDSEPPGPVFGLGFRQLAGLAVCIAGVAGESIADLQLARFRADPSNAGRVCRSGLWRWSRHPNYFFEWTVWVGFALWACGSRFGWIGFAAPALMLHFLLNVTGIPMTEALSVRSKGAAYLEYQRTTSAFFPWFNRRA